MRRRRRVDHQRLRIPQVRQQRENLQRVDKLLPRVEPAPDPERDQPARAIRQILLRPRRILARLQPRIIHPLHARVLLQMLGHRQRVLRVPLHAQVQRLKPQQEQPRVKR